MEGSNGSQNGERMIGTRGKMDAGRGIDSFWSEEPTERSRDNKTAEDAGEHRVTRDVGVTRRGRRTQGRCRVDAVILGRVVRK